MSRCLFAVLLACGLGWGTMSASAAGLDGSRFPDEGKIAFEQGEALQDSRGRTPISQTALKPRDSWDSRLRRSFSGSRPSCAPNLCRLF